MLSQNKIHKIFSLRNLFFFLSFFMFSSAVSQDSKQLIIQGFVLGKNNQKLDGALLTLYKNGKKISEKTTSGNSKFLFYLHLNSSYALETSKRFYTTKRYNFSTYVPKDASPEYGASWFYMFNILLPPKSNEEIDSSIADIHLTNVGYDQKNNKFFHDIKYTGAVKEEIKISSSEPESKFSDFHAKLLYGKGIKKPLVDQTVLLENSDGKVLKESKTDMYGDFSFKNVNTEEPHNMVLGENENIPPGTPVFLAKQNGIIINEFIKDKNNRFSFKLLPYEFHKLTLIEEVDVSLKIEDFQKSDKKELTIIENIYYPSGSWDIQPDAAKALDKIVGILKQNPNIIIELSSHTDANGNDEYNLKLSGKRAASAVQFIISKDIDKNRVSGKGYGESKILNRCLNGVKCSKKEHSLNRRTEIRFVKVG
ncbi:MAG: OmpA family protein [Bacteroidia bacterium]|nr:OmpA family protein [Bacteroidia bacterium]